MIEIEKGVPIPARVYTGRPSKYPFANLEVNESFRVDGNMQTAQSAIATAKKRFPGQAWTARAIENENYVRVWRIA